MAEITDKFGKASIDNNYAIATTVKTTRTAGVTVLEAFDLSKYSVDTPVYFVTYKKTTDPITNEVTVTNLVSWKGLVNVGANTLTNLELAPGYTDDGNDIGDFIECIPTSLWVNDLIDGIFVGHNPDGTFKKAAIQSALGNDGNLVESLNDLTSDVVISGGVWAALAGLNASMTELVAYIDGYKNTVAAVATRAFTLSKDTYVDVLRNTSTNVFTLVYTEVANGDASPVLAANSMRIAKVVSSGAAITSVVQYDYDSLGNIIFNQDPNQTVIGFKELVSTNSIASVGARGVFPNWNIKVKVLKSQRIKITMTLPQTYTTSDGVRHDFSIWEDGVKCIGTFYQRLWSVGNGGNTLTLVATTRPTPGTHTYALEVKTTNATVTIYGNNVTGSNENQATGIITVEKV